MKGISTVIATILMLMITIGLAAVAATYIFDIFGGQTDVLLSVSNAFCTDSNIKVFVENSGSAQATNVDVDITDSTGSAEGSCGVQMTIDPQTVATCEVTFVPTQGETYNIIAYAAGDVSDKVEVTC